MSCQIMKADSSCLFVLPSYICLLLVLIELLNSNTTNDVGAEYICVYVNQRLPSGSFIRCCSYIELLPLVPFHTAMVTFANPEPMWLGSTMPGNDQVGRTHMIDPPFKGGCRTVRRCH